MRDGEEGFTLIELLVVILIIGILASIAIPAYLGQQSKANASSAKSDAAQAMRAAESFGLGRGGTYAGMTPANLVDEQPALNGASGDGRLLVSGVTNTTPEATSYVVGVRAKGANGGYFAFYKDQTGMRRLCSPGGAPGCSSAIPGLSYPGYSSIGTW